MYLWQILLLKFSFRLLVIALIDWERKSLKKIRDENLPALNLCLEIFGERANVHHIRISLFEVPAWQAKM